MSTTEPQSPQSPAPENSFEREARQQAPGLIREFYDFLRFNKAWWLTPIIIVLLLVGVLVVLAGTSVAPFIYPFM